MNYGICNCSFSSITEKLEVSYIIEDLPLDSFPAEIWLPESFAINASSMTNMQNKFCLVWP